MSETVLLGGDALYEAAARWHIRMAQPVGDVDEVAQFEAWLQESPRHRDALEETRRMLAAFDAEGQSPEITALHRDMQERADVSRNRRRWKAVGIMAGMVLSVAAAAWSGLGRAPSSHSEIRTAVNEMRDVRLRDGSLLSVDADTQLDVTLAGDARTIRLHRGQARFRVAHDSSRPFRVVVADRIVIATGTDFNVERLNARTIITLLAGGVRVAPPEEHGLLAWMDRRNGPDPASIELLPGESLDMSGDSITKFRGIDVHEAIAWQSGNILFNNETLASAIERLNRYNRRTIKIDDKELGPRLISGMFVARDPDAFANAVSQFMGIRSQLGSDDAIHLFIPRD